MRNADPSVALAVAVICSASLFAGCGGEEGPGPAGQALPSTWQVVKRDGTLVIGIGQEAAPFGFMDGMELVGFDVDIARAVAARLEAYADRDLQVVFRAVTDETRISWVQSGEVHLSLCHTNITRKRNANIDFTVPYGWDGKGVLYDARKGPRDLADFAGKTIGIKRASSSEGEIQAYFLKQGWPDVRLRYYDSHVAGIQAVVDGQVDGFSDDNSIITNTAMKAGHGVGPGKVLDITPTSYSPAYFGIGVSENDSDWRDVLNYCLHDLWDSGEFHTIYDKWFGPASMCPIALGDHGMEPFVEG